MGICSACISLNLIQLADCSHFSAQGLMIEPSADAGSLTKPGQSLGALAQRGGSETRAKYCCAAVLLCCCAAV